MVQTVLRMSAYLEVVEMLRHSRTGGGSVVHSRPPSLPVPLMFPTYLHATPT